MKIHKSRKRRQVERHFHERIERMTHLMHHMIDKYSRYATGFDQINELRHEVHFLKILLATHDDVLQEICDVCKVDFNPVERARKLREEVETYVALEELKKPLATH